MHVSPAGSRLQRVARSATILGAVVAVVLTAAQMAGAADRGRSGPYAAARVLVLGVPGLVASDLSPSTTPHLWSLAAGHPVGALTVRAADSTTCVLDGWATLGAGNRARFPSAALPPAATGAVAAQGQITTSTSPGPAVSGCAAQERAAHEGLADPLRAVAAVAADSETARFGAVPGALGAAVGCATTVGHAASVAGAVPGVTSTTADALPADAPGLAALLARCRLTLVAPDSIPAVGASPVGASPTGVAPAGRAVALRTLDQSVDRLRTAARRLPGGTLLLLLGISEAGDSQPKLHVAIAAGPGFSTAGWLTSASTNRSPFVQLIDVAPTVLRSLGLTAPASMNGQPMQSVGSRPGLLPTLTRLGRLGTAASVHYASTGTFFRLLVFLVALLVALGMLAVGDLWFSPAPSWRPPTSAVELLRRAVRPLALLAAALPVATVLANLLPWDASNAPGATLFLAVLGFDVVVAAAAGLGPWRRPRLGAPLAVLTLTAVSLAVDAVTGSHLELDGMLGYDAIVAGRFTGFGGLALGVFLPAALLLAAAAAALLGRHVPAQRVRLVVAGTVTMIGVVVVALIGAPSAGQKFGGVLAAVPAFLVLGMLLTHVRVTAWRLLVTLVVGVVTVSVVVLADWLKPATQRSHLGRFADQLFTGQAWTVVTRKAHSNLGILVGSPIVWLLPVALAAAWWLIRPGGRLRDGTTLQLPASDVAVLRAGLIASALSLAIATVVEDSGAAIPAAGAAMLVPMLVWLAAPSRDASAVHDQPMTGDRLQSAAPGSPA